MLKSERARLIADAVRSIERDATRFGDEFREQRLRLRVTQADVARIAGVSPTMVWRVEHGDPTAPLEARARCARAVGATTRLALYADASALIYDAGHARMVERIAAWAGPAWSVILEARVPGPGHRSSDVRLESPRDLILIEVESHVRRWEEIQREVADKRAAVAEAGETRPIHVVLGLPPTRHHVALVRSLPASIAAAFPVDPGDLRRALTESGSWPGDGLLWVPRGKERATAA